MCGACYYAWFCAGRIVETRAIDFTLHSKGLHWSCATFGWKTYRSTGCRRCGRCCRSMLVDRPKNVCIAQFICWRFCLPTLFTARHCRCPHACDTHGKHCAACVQPTKPPNRSCVVTHTFWSDDLLKRRCAGRIRSDCAHNILRTSLEGELGNDTAPHADTIYACAGYVLMHDSVQDVAYTFCGNNLVKHIFWPAKTHPLPSANPVGASKICFMHGIVRTCLQRNLGMIFHLE